MSRSASYLQTASWMLILAALFVIPSLKPEGTQELFPVRPELAEGGSNPEAFFIVCPGPPAFTVYELTASVVIIVAAMLWLVSFALMVEERGRMVDVLVKEAKARLRRVERLWQPSFK